MLLISGPRFQKSVGTVLDCLCEISIYSWNVSDLLRYFPSKKIVSRQQSVGGKQQPALREDEDPAVRWDGWCVWMRPWWREREKREEGDVYGWGVARPVNCLWNENGSLAESRTLGRCAGSMSLIYCLKACQREREAEGGDAGRRRGRPDGEKLELEGRRVL